MLKLTKDVILKDYQVEASNFATSRPASLLSMKTGVGKSVVGIDVSAFLLNNDKVNKVIIFGTKSSILELTNDFKNKLEYSGGYSFKPFIILDDASLFEFFKNNDNDIGFIQYETLHKIDLALFNRGLVKYKTAVLLDESHKVKNPKALLTKSIVALRKSMEYLILLTATPLTSNLFDLFYQVQILDSKIFINKTRFTEQFVEMRMVKNFKTGRQYPEIVKYKNLELLREKLKDICYDYYPEQDTNYLIHKTIIDNTDKYIEAAEGLLGTKDAKIHAARLVDLQHVVDKSKNKLKLYLNLVKKLLPKGLITYCHFRETVNLLSKAFDKFNIDYKVIHGQVSSKDRKEIKSWFNENPSNKVLIITSAGSQSLNLQSVNDMIFYNIPFGWGAFSQAKGRIERLFSKHTKFNIHFILTEIEYNNTTTGTVDYYKYELISSYGELTTTVFEANEVPKSKLQSFNKNLMAKIRKETLWKKSKSAGKRRIKRLGDCSNE